MERIELNIIQEADEGIIKVSAGRNGQPIFAEEFRSAESTTYPPHTLSAENIEDTTDAETCASASVLRSLVHDIEQSEKTSSKALYEQSQSKFQLASLIDIKQFESLAGIRFDYSQFSNLQEFQRYFKSLLITQ